MTSCYLSNATQCLNDSWSLEYGVPIGMATDRIGHI